MSTTTTSGSKRVGPAIRTSNLTKDYGDGFGVFDLDLTVHRGEVFGYLGPNGAGKSTTIRMLLDMVRPSRGSVEVLGHDPRGFGPDLRQRIAYVPGELALWKGWTAGSILDYLGSLRGGFDRDRVAGLAERLRLDLDRVVGDLSKGNKQKVGLVAAFATDAELMILDEPTSGLDPLLQVEFQRMVRETADRGATVLLSSHVLSEVEHVANRVGIIRRGRLVDVLGVDDLKAQASQTLEITFDHPAPTAFAAVSDVETIATEGNVGRYSVSGSADPFVKALAGHTVLTIRGLDEDLEQIFLRYYDDQEHVAATPAPVTVAADKTKRTPAGTAATVEAVPGDGPRPGQRETDAEPVDVSSADAGTDPDSAATTDTGPVASPPPGPTADSVPVAQVDPLTPAEEEIMAQIDASRSGSPDDAGPTRDVISTDDIVSREDIVRPEDLVSPDDLVPPDDLAPPRGLSTPDGPSPTDDVSTETDR